MADRSGVTLLPVHFVGPEGRFFRSILEQHMSDKRDFHVFLDGEPFTQGTGFRLTGRVDLNLYPDLFVLQCRNLPKEAIFQLQNARQISVLSNGSRLASRQISSLSNGSCLASGQISDVYTQTVPEGTVTVAAFSLGLDLWNADVCVSCPAGTSISEDVRAILEASGTGIQLLSFPGENPLPLRGRAYAGKAAEAVASALSQASARGFLTPAGLQVIPKDPLSASLHLTEADLTDRPVFADSGRKMILSTNVVGFQPGDEMTLSFEGTTTKGLITSRLVDADSYAGLWRTQLLVELR